MSLDPWQKSDFYELDKTVDLVSNFQQNCANGHTKVAHNINYEKNTHLTTVLFMENYMLDDEDVVIKFARKTQNQKNLDKLQESKKEALKIIKSSLMDQSFTLQERLKQRKLRMLKGNKENKHSNKKKHADIEEEGDFDYVDVDQANDNPKIDRLIPEVQGVGKAYYESVLSTNKHLERIGGLAVESPDISKISNTHEMQA